MKILFLDFDGVLNSKQEVIWHRRFNKRKRSFKTIWHEWAYLLIRAFRTVHYKLFPKGHNLGWELTNLSLFYLTDHCEFDPIACSNVQLLLDEIPDLRIVVSSTWRGWGLAWCKKILAKNGIDPTKVIATTGNGGSDRGDQCLDWITAARMGGREIEAFVAIDDDGDFKNMMDRLVQTDSHVGFSIRDAYKVGKLFDNAIAKNSTLFDGL